MGKWVERESEREEKTMTEKGTERKLGQVMDMLNSRTCVSTHIHTHTHKVTTTLLPKPPLQKI